MKIACVWTLPLLALLATGCTSMKIHCDRDRDYDFSTVATYRWIATPEDILKEPDTYPNPEFSRAIDDELAARGLRCVAADAAADVQVICYAKLREEMEYTEPAGSEEPSISGGLVYSQQTGGWKFKQTGPDINAYAVEIGTLTVLIDDARSGRRIWSGSLQAKIDRSQPKETLNDRIDEMVRKLMEKLPVRRQ